MKNDLKNMDQRVSVRLPGEIARALDRYCKITTLTDQPLSGRL